jgi:hypothetical protein
MTGAMSSTRIRLTRWGNRIGVTLYRGTDGRLVGPTRIFLSIERTCPPGSGVDRAQLDPAGLASARSGDGRYPLTVR